MPTFATTMEMGLAGLVNSDATVRRMLIISDGDPSAPTEKLLKAFQQAMITVSTVTVSPHGETDTISMKRIADATGGTAYTPDNPTELPAIFVKEARTLKRSMIQEGTIAPRPGMPSTLLSNLQDAPPLHGYVLTTLKPRAEPVLLAPTSQTETAASSTAPPAPILARWKYGPGTTAAFTSDLTTRWGRDWLKWEKFDSIVSQLMTSLSRVRKQAQIRLWTHLSSGEAVIIVEDFADESLNLDGGLGELVAVVNGPDDFSATLRLQQVGPRRYEARLPLPAQGKYQVIARGNWNGRTESATEGFIVSYSAEYLRFRSDPIMLKQIQERTGGQLLAGDSAADDVFGDRQPKSSTRPIFDWLLISLAILLPIDVAVRRVHIDWFFLQSIFLRDKRDSQPTTLGSLLATKQETEAQFESSRSATRMPEDIAATTPVPSTSPASERSMPTAANSKSTRPPAADTTADAQRTTLSKLLAIKRQQEEDGGDSENDAKPDGNV